MSWDERWAAAPPPGPPAPLLLSLDAVLPRRGWALDLACGRGRQALWLARRGLSVTAVDASATALALLAADAARESLDLHTVQVDLETGSLPPGPWDLVCCVDYLQPALFPALAQVLAPGGWLLFSQATVHNLARHAHPSRRFLVDPQDVAAFAIGLETVRCDADWRPDGRHEAWLAARRPPVPALRPASGRGIA